MNAVEEIFPEDFEPRGEWVERMRKLQGERNPITLDAIAEIGRDVMRKIAAAAPVSTRRRWPAERSRAGLCARCEAQLPLVDDCSCGFCMSCHDVIVGEQGLVARCPVHP